MYFHTPNVFHIVLFVEAPSYVTPKTSPPASSTSKIAFTTNFARSIPLKLNVNELQLKISCYNNHIHLGIS